MTVCPRSISARRTCAFAASTLALRPARPTITGPHILPADLPRGARLPQLGLGGAQGRDLLVPLARRHPAIGNQRVDPAHVGLDTKQLRLGIADRGILAKLVGLASIFCACIELSRLETWVRTLARAWATFALIDLVLDPDENLARLDISGNP